MARRLGPKTDREDESSGGEHLGEVVALVHGDPAGRPPAPGYRLPVFVSSVVGRSDQIDEVVALLGSARLVTLTGPGGVGKTRLAVEVAERASPNRVFFVDLAPVRDGALVGEQIASAFGVGELGHRRLAQALARELSGDALLVLDNCERLVGACADLAQELLHDWPGLQILATSQQRLGVSGEVVWWVPPLGLPEPSLDLATDAALESDAVQLFCERATAVRRDFVPSPANIEDIVEICQRLDGNPLAIELAAARVDVLSPAEIAARLEARFELLQGGPGVGPARHQTLAAALEWSNELLDESERMLLRRLSVFTGGFSLSAAESVCGGRGIDRHRVLHLLSALVTKSLVVADTGGKIARYRLLDTVRHYASDALAATGEATETAERHARWCLDVVTQSPRTGDEARRFGALRAEQCNVRAALDRCIVEGWDELALRLAAEEMPFWQDSGRFAEAQEWLGRTLAISEGAPPALRAVTRRDAGFAALMLGDFEGARAHLSASVDLWTEIGDRAAAERTQGLMGVVSMLSGGPEGVEDLERGLDRVRAMADDARLAESLFSCAQARLFRGEPVAAQRYFEELVPLARRRCDDSMVANGLVGLGAAALGMGDYRRAEVNLREGVAVAVAAGQAHTGAVGTAWLAELDRLRGDLARARAGFEESLAQARTLDTPFPLAKALVGLGRVSLEEGSYEAAQALLAEAAKVAGEGGQVHVLGPALIGLGEVAVAIGDADMAGAHFNDAHAVAGRRGDRATTAQSTYHLAELARAQGALTEALSLHHQALRQRHETGDRAAVADSLEGLAGVAATTGDHEMAARLFGATQALRDAGGFAPPHRRRDTRAADLALLEQQMPPEERKRAWAQGVTLTGDEAVAYAIKGRGPRSRPAQGPDSLTPTERTVAALVVQGLTNPEIAERLFVSPRTVQTHLRAVYLKLDVGSRRQLRQVWSEGRGPG